jgi:hypothetical protein
MIRILRDYMPNADFSVGEDIVRAAWRHAGISLKGTGLSLRESEETYLSEIPCRVSNIARGGGNAVPFNRLKSVKPYRHLLQVCRGQYRG